MNPTPAELNRICQAISEEHNVFLEVGCFCCPQHGINKLYTLLLSLSRPVIWAFSALSQVEHAGKTGLLRFHYGQYWKGEFNIPLGAVTTITDAFRDRGVTVEWSGDMRDTFGIRVDAEAFAAVSAELKEEFDTSEPHHLEGEASAYLEPPVFAEIVAPEDPLFAITLWPDPAAAHWWYNVSDRHPSGGTHEQRHEPTRSEALAAALALAEELRLEIN